MFNKNKQKNKIKTLRHHTKKARKGYTRQTGETESVFTDNASVPQKQKSHIEKDDKLKIHSFLL